MDINHVVIALSIDENGKPIQVPTFEKENKELTGMLRATCLSEVGKMYEAVEVYNTAVKALAEKYATTAQQLYVEWNAL
jgi:acyl-CoA hydrolase